MEKRCRKCDEVKSLDDFHRSNNSPDGRQYRCKPCSISAARQRALDNPEAKRAADARYGKSDKCKANRKARREGEQREVILEQKRESHARHADNINERRRKDREMRPDHYRAWQREYYAKNRFKIIDQTADWTARNRESRQAYNRRRDFGLEHDDFMAMMEDQSGLCAICGIDMESARQIMPTGWTRTGVNVDHCHESGLVRGLLCSPCNKGLGQFRDNPDAMRAAAEYVEKHRAPFAPTA